MRGRAGGAMQKRQQNKSLSLFLHMRSEMDWPINFVKNIGVLVPSLRNKVNITLPERIIIEFLFIQGAFHDNLNFGPS
jgi:hypothetical protein